MSKIPPPTPYSFSMLIILTILAVSCGRRISTPPTVTPTLVVNEQKTATIPMVLPTATIPLVHPTDTREFVEDPFHLPGNPDEIRDLVPSSIVCRFPCFLGIIPGKTDYQTAIEELGKVSTSIAGDGKSFDGKLGYNFTLYYPDSDLDISTDIKTLDKNKVLELILYPTTSLAKFYSVSEVIDYYKAPDNVFVFTLSEPYGDGVLPFDLILDYSSKGFILWYRNPDTKIESNLLNLCYRPENAPTIFLWSPDDQRTFLDIAPIGKAGSRDAKQIKDIMLSNSGNISEILTNPDGFCVQSNVQNWKDISEYY